LSAAREAPLIVHVVHHFAVGGMENGMVNILNTLPSKKYRHAVVCLTNYTDFSKRVVAQAAGAGCFYLCKIMAQVA
jgi:hypothetical protein